MYDNVLLTAKILTGVTIAANISIISQARVVAAELTKLVLYPLIIEITFITDLDGSTVLAVVLHPLSFFIITFNALIFRFGSADGIRAVAQTDGGSTTIAGVSAFGPKSKAVLLSSFGKPNLVAGLRIITKAFW